MERYEPLQPAGGERCRSELKRRCRYMCQYSQRAPDESERASVLASPAVMPVGQITDGKPGLFISGGALYISRRQNTLCLLSPTACVWQGPPTEGLWLNQLPRAKRPVNDTGTRDPALKF